MLDARQSRAFLPHPLRPPPRPPPAPAALPGIGQSAVGAFPHSCAPVPASTCSGQAVTGTCSAAPALCSALPPEGAAPHRGTRSIRRAKGYTATGLCPAELSVWCSEVLRPAPLPARIVCSRGGGSQHCWTAGGAAQPCGSEPPAVLLLPNACADRGARSTWGCCCALVLAVWFGIRSLLRTPHVAIVVLMWLWSSCGRCVVGFGAVMEVTAGVISPFILPLAPEYERPQTDLLLSGVLTTPISEPQTPPGLIILIWMYAAV